MDLSNSDLLVTPHHHAGHMPLLTSTIIELRIGFPVSCRNSVRRNWAGMVDNSTVNIANPILAAQALLPALYACASL